MLTSQLINVFDRTSTPMMLSYSIIKKGEIWDIFVKQPGAVCHAVPLTLLASPSCDAALWKMFTGSDKSRKVSIIESFKVQFTRSLRDALTCEHFL